MCGVHVVRGQNRNVGEYVKSAAGTLDGLGRGGHRGRRYRIVAVCVGMRMDGWRDVEDVDCEGMWHTEVRWAKGM